MKCVKCGNIVYEENEVVEVSEGYSYYCNKCDEDKYSFEVEPASKSELLTELIKIVRADEKFNILCEYNIVMHADFDDYCEELNLSAQNNQDAVDEVSAMIDNICKYIEDEDKKERESSISDKIDRLLDDEELSLTVWDFNDNGEYDGEYYILKLDLDLEYLNAPRNNFWSCDINKLTKEEFEQYKEYWISISYVTFLYGDALASKIKEIQGKYGLELVDYYVDDQYNMMDRFYLKFKGGE